MEYRYAKRLHNGDEVIEKGTGASLFVVEVEEKNVFILCDDGQLYHHTAVR